MRQLSPATWADVWDLAALASLGLDPDRIGSVLRHSWHIGLAGQPAVPGEDLERVLFETSLSEEVRP